MGFNKINLPSLDKIVEMIETEPESTMRWLTKADAMQGPADSVNYVQKIINEKNTTAKRVHQR